MAVLPSPIQFISSIPPVTRGFTAATVLTSLLYLCLQWSQPDQAYSPYLTLVPGSSLFYPWTFLTSTLVETSVLEFVATIIFVPASLRYLERLWGSIETLKFMLVSIAIPNLISFAFNWLEFIATKNPVFLYGMEYHGQMALQTAILVAFTQLIPEHQVQIMGIIKARVKRLPMAYLTLSTVLTILGFQCPWILIQFGWFVGWVYLRFYKRNSGDAVGGDVYGDRSETFALIHWFPPFLHYPVSLLADFVYYWASHLRLVPSSDPDLESGNSYAQLPGGARAEAERRRAMALKALDQRLANSNSSNSSAPTQAQLPRPPPTASTSKNDGASTRANERKKSLGDADIGVMENANSGSS